MSRLDGLDLTSLTPYIRRMSRFAVAAQTFERTLDHLDLPPAYREAETQAALGRRAALLAVADALWRDRLGPMLDVAEVKTLLGVGTRQAVHDFARRGRLLALPGPGGRILYPAFQFRRGGRPYDVLPDLLKRFRDAGVRPHTLAAWFKTPQGLLGGRTPVAWMEAGRDPATLLEAARRTAARLGR